MSESWSFEEWFNALPFADIETLNKDDQNCGICRLEYSYSSSSNISDQEDPPEKPVLLPCGHVFGQHCLKTWLSPAPEGGNSNACPMCRHKLFEAGPGDDAFMIDTLDHFRRLEEMNFIQDPVVRMVYRGQRAAPTGDEAVQLGWGERIREERLRLAGIIQAFNEQEQEEEEERRRRAARAIDWARRELRERRWRYRAIHEHRDWEPREQREQSEQRNQERRAR